MNNVIRRGDGEILWLGGSDHGRPVEILVEPGTTGTRAFTMGAQNLPPGGQVPTHHHPYEEILFVYQGRARHSGCAVRSCQWRRAGAGARGGCQNGCR